MVKLSGITSEPKQIFRSQLDNGNTIIWTLKYSPATQMWFLDFEYQDIICRGIRLCYNLNILRQYQYGIPFGLFVEVNDGTEPFLINDFVEERVVLYLLNQNEVQQVEEGLSGA